MWCQFIFRKYHQRYSQLAMMWLEVRILARDIDVFCFSSITNVVNGEVSSKSNGNFIFECVYIILIESFEKTHFFKLNAQSVPLNSAC